MKQQKSISKQNKKNLGRFSQTIVISVMLVGIFTSCASNQSLEILETIEPAATLSLQEIVDIVKENENTFTIEQLDTYIRINGIDWEGDVESMIEDNENAGVPFKYFFIEENYKNSGVFFYPFPYEYSSKTSISDKTGIKSANEDMLGKIIESIYHDLWINEDEEYYMGWDEEPNKYTVIIFIKQSTNDEGKSIDELYYNIGGFTFIDFEDSAKYISLDKIINQELSDEEIDLFTNKVLEYIQEGYTIFRTNENGEIDAGNNFKEFREQLNSAVEEEAAAKEQRLNEIAAVVEGNQNTFTIEELNAYLQEYGTGWESGIEPMIEYYQGTRAPFQYYFIEDNKKDSGVWAQPFLFQHSTERTMRGTNPFPTPIVSNENLFEKMIESIYIDLHFRNDDGTLGYDKEPGKYTVVIYMKEGNDNEGEPIDEMYYNIGGYTFIDGYENVKYISLEKIINHELTDEEIALFSDRILRYIQEGYTVFTLNKSGNVNGAGCNFNELKALMDAAMLEQENSAEE